MTDETSRAGGRRLVATSAGKARKKRLDWRKRGPFAAVVVLCVAALVAALTAAAQPLRNTPFALTGHWVYNSVLNAAFHVDGATANIDAEAPLPADPGSQVVQGETSGYVVGSSRITQFGKSTLSVESTTAPPANEVPVGLEVTGGPYLVYRNAGKVVRLGDPSATLSTGGPVGDPVATPEGAVWLYRTGTGLLCELDKGADRITSCPVVSPRDHAGALTMIGGKPALVDLTAGTMHTVDQDRLGPGVPLGVPVSASARPAGNDVDGRVAILDPAGHRLILADTANPPAKPVTVTLPGGDYDGPVSTGSAVAVVDRTNGKLLTFGADGAPKDAKSLPPGAPRLSRGEDSRAYVEDTGGTHVLIVAKDGKVQDVPVTGKPSGDGQRAPGNAGPVADQPQGQPNPQNGDSQRGPGTGSRPPGNPPATKTPPAQQKPPARPPSIPASAPGAPRSVSATAGDGSATVTWAAAPDNRSPITSYRVTADGGTRHVAISVGGGARSATVNGLTNGTPFTLTVTASNAVGTGPGASSNPVTPTAAAAPAVATVARGVEDCPDYPDEPDCAQMHVHVTGLTPGTRYKIFPHSDDPGYSNPGSSQTANAAGVVDFNAFQYFGVGHLVWVTVEKSSETIATSSKIRWTQGTRPPQSVTIKQGSPMETGNCHAPDCYAVNVTMTGFSPNTTYRITLHSSSNNNVWTETETTDSSGNATHNTGDYDVPGETVWVTVGSATSNKITWS